MSPSVQKKSCAVRRQLADDLWKIHTELADLNSRDIQCVLAGDWDGSKALAGDVMRARMRRAAALDALKQHTAEHQCEPILP
jgi:hypothetical protein